MEPVRARLAELAPGVELLENLRFDPARPSNDAAFVAELVDGIDSTSTTRSVPRTGRTRRSSGRRSRCRRRWVGCWPKEVDVLLGLRNNPKRPFVAVLGGAKISDKLGVVEALLEIVDSLVIGGAMCFTFFAAQGKPIGDSLFEPDQVDTCAPDPRRPSERTDDPPARRHRRARRRRRLRHVGARSCPDGAKGFDIGPGSAAAFSDVIMDARMVFWNGPMGMFEDERFAAGTRTVAQAMADTKAFTVVGGGDSAAALAQFGLDDEVDHVSTGGGASLELLENGDLPGLAALQTEHPMPE